MNVVHFFLLLRFHCLSLLVDAGLQGQVGLLGRRAVALLELEQNEHLVVVVLRTKT